MVEPKEVSFTYEGRDITAMLLDDGRRIKAKSKNSSSGDCWVGFCYHCKIASCSLVHVPRNVLEEVQRGTYKDIIEKK